MFHEVAVKAKNAERIMNVLDVLKKDANERSHYWIEQLVTDPDNDYYLRELNKHKAMLDTLDSIEALLKDEITKAI